MKTWADDYIDANGIRLHYHRSGGDKPPLVMAHGLTDNGLCWSRLARALEDDFDLIMVDARGHGLSDKPESDYNSSYHADDLAGVIRGLGVAPTALIGHSMGGASSALATERYPELVNRLILEDPAWFPPEPTDAPEDEAEIQQRRQEWRERILARQALSIPELTAATRQANPLWSDEEFPAHSEAKHQVSINVAQFVRTRVKPWWEVVPGLRCPTLVLTGENERGAIITPGMAERIHALNPGVTVVRLDGAGHNVRREQFDAFLRHVRAFLAQHPAQ